MMSPLSLLSLLPLISLNRIGMAYSCTRHYIIIHVCERGRALMKPCSSTIYEHPVHVVHCAVI